MSWNESVSFGGSACIKGQQFLQTFAFTECLGSNLARIWRSVSPLQVRMLAE